jgi:hypothetical protein
LKEDVISNEIIGNNISNNIILANNNISIINTMVNKNINSTKNYISSICDINYSEKKNNKIE